MVEVEGLERQRATRRVWEEKPVSVGRFVREAEYLGLGDDGAYPVILRSLSKIFRGRYQEAVLCWGIGSGKSFLCSLALTYMLYRTLCLRDPQEYYGLAQGSQISLVTVGPTARIAEKVVFGEVRELVRRSPWFTERYPADGRVRKELHFAKSVTVLPGNSSELFPLGLNVLCATMDEASFFVETADGTREAAEEVYLALQRRVKSRFGSKGLVLIASSPRHAEDFIMRKVAEGDEDPTLFASRKATWEVKPRGKFCGKVFEQGGLTVPVEYAGEFKKNPQKARRDLAALPGTAFQPFFVDMEPMLAACGKTDGTARRGTAETGGPRSAPTVVKTAGGPRSTPTLQHPFEANGALASWFKPNDREARFIHVDLGLRRDACGIAVAKVQEYAELPVVTVELMLQIKAPPDGEVDFGQVRELILALRRRGFPIGQVSYDGWQSADSQQILRRQGLKVATVSVDSTLAGYETLKEVANEGRLRMYEYEPFLRECRRLELVRGTKVDHPPGGSKDVADAVAGAVSEAMRARGGGEVRGRIV
ncbi:MAG: hypothetical protein ABFE07_05860 [Armatimonadia bacterium]